VPKSPDRGSDGGRPARGAGGRAAPARRARPEEIEALIAPLVVALAAGEDFDGADFGFQQQNSSIAGFSYKDKRGNGVLDPPDRALAGATVYLDLNGNGVLDAGEPAALSDSDGLYEITGLGAGTYSVIAIGPTGYAATTSLPISVTIAAGEAFGGVDIGFERRDARIEGIVFDDRNWNRRRNGNEPGIPDVTLELIEVQIPGLFNSSVIATTTSGADGRYAFTDLARGFYLVRVTDENDVLDGWFQTSLFTLELVILQAGEHETGIDFGFAQPWWLSRIAVPTAEQSLCLGQPTVLEALTDAWVPLSYQWRKDGEPIEGATDVTFEIAALSEDDAGLYDCVMSNGFTVAVTTPIEVKPSQVGLELGAQPQGLDPLSLSVEILCGREPFTWTWYADGFALGDDLDTLTLPSVLDETTLISLVVTDDNGFEITAETLVLVARDPSLLDLNGDGCNTSADLFQLTGQWGDGTGTDLDGDGRLDLRDFLYINTSGDCPNP